eukprot:350381-Chlamydomonas_euryale.AAC.6
MGSCQACRFPAFLRLTPTIFSRAVTTMTLAWAPALQPVPRTALRAPRRMRRSGAGESRQPRRRSSSHGAAAGAEDGPEGATPDALKRRGWQPELAAEYCARCSCRHVQLPAYAMRHAPGAPPP